jgi:tetratricopeptide (TPR) repeat protein
MAVIQDRASPSSKTLTTHISVFLVLGLIGILLYGHTLQVPLYLDDFINIRDNLYAIRSSLSPRELINASFEGFANHRPLANLSFSLNYYFHGLQLPGYHMVNIVIHVLNGVLLYLFIFKTITLPAQRNASQHPVWVATLASLLWFVNPMQIQSVTYIVQRMTSMATLFFLSSFLCYLYGRLSHKRRVRIILFLLSAFCWVLSLASKQIGVTLPVLVFAYEWFFFQNLNKRWLIKGGSFLLIGIAGVLAIVYFVYHETPLSFVTTISQPRQYTAFERFLTQGRVIFLCMSLLLYPNPSRLTLNHDIPISHNLLDPVTTPFSLVGLILFLVITILVAKSHRLAAFCIIWFFANLAIEALAASIEPMFEHRMYLPSMLFFLPFVWMAFRKLNKPKIVIPAMTAFIFIFSLWTYQRNALWNDPVAFWEDAVRKSPNHHRSNGNLGIAYLNARAYDGAIAAFEKTLTLSPPYPTEIYTNMGMLYLETGQRDLARQKLARAMQLNPDNYLALNGLGILEQKEQNYGKALKHYLMAIEMNANFASSHYNLGMLYMDMGDLNNAVKTFMRALELRPMWSEAYSSLGLAWARQGRYDLSIPVLQKAISIEAGNQEALFNLAKAYDLCGRHEMAARTYKTLIEMHPEDVEAMHNLALIYLNHLKNVEQAKLYFSMALATDPEYDHGAIARDILSQTAVKP